MRCVDDDKYQYSEVIYWEYSLRSATYKFDVLFTKRFITVDYKYRCNEKTAEYEKQVYTIKTGSEILTYKVGKVADQYHQYGNSTQTVKAGFMF